MPGENLPALLAVMERLLAPDGCPWDREQTLETLKAYLIEEAYEVIEAIDAGNPGRHRDELGDLLFQVVFQSALCARQSGFGMDEVIAALHAKLVRRHPHLFGDARVSSARDQSRLWERIKADERAGRGEPRGALAGVPRAAPALLRAQRLGDKAGAAGFDWRDTEHVAGKVREELGELAEAVASGDRAHAGRELGDLLFAIAQMARHLDLSAEDALRGAIGRFSRRFAWMEERLAARGKTTSQASADELDALWEQAKRATAEEAAATGKADGADAGAAEAGTAGKPDGADAGAAEAGAAEAAPAGNAAARARP